MAAMRRWSCPPRSSLSSRPHRPSIQSRPPDLLLSPHSRRHALLTDRLTPMGSSRLFLDPLALRAFHDTLQARLDESLSALAMAESGPRLLGPDPLLGTFD